MVRFIYYDDYDGSITATPLNSTMVRFILPPSITFGSSFPFKFHYGKIHIVGSVKLPTLIKL